MKKTITVIFMSILMACNSAIADSTNIGVSFGMANMDATGSHTTSSASGASGGDAVSSAGDADFELASIFIEREIEAGAANIVIGLDAIPFTAEVDKLGGGDGFDATVEVGNLLTAYIQPTFNAAGDVQLFVKAGYAQADLDIIETSRQATATGTAGTDGDTEKSLEGPMFGIGLQKGMDNGFVRLEGTFTDFDEISHTNSNGKVLKADAEMTRISISLGRSF